MTSALFEVLGDEEFCVTAVRGLDEAEVLSRLGAGAGPVPCYPMEDVIAQVHPETEAARIYAPRDGDWAFLLDVIGSEGWSQSAPVLARLCRGTEAVSVCKVLDFTTKVVLARDGAVVARFDVWLDQRPSGPRADDLARILSLPAEGKPEELFSPGAVLEAVEKEFGLRRVDPAALTGPLPTITASALNS
ncbi:DUF6461 domain-containing protein [Streptomyces albus]|uniref:DUF6461 domain-containing protein n=1 Tax=Streptomyces albus TaxID=1888 RepID=UPI0034056BBB